VINAVNNPVWSGTWVAERLGVELVGDDKLTDLLGLALRRNPKRAHLLVSNVLGKHVPQSPSVVYGYGFALGRRVRELLGAEEAARAVVLGYAETATGLGHSVADGVGLAPYLHSTEYAETSARSAAYLFASEDDYATVFPEHGFTPDKGSRHGGSRRRRRKAVTPMRTGLLGVSDQTVARRYRRLREAGEVRVVARPDPVRLGHDMWLLRLRCTPDAATAVHRFPAPWARDVRDPARAAPIRTVRAHG